MQALPLQPDQVPPQQDWHLRNDAVPSGSPPEKQMLSIMKPSHLLCTLSLASRIMPAKAADCPHVLCCKSGLAASNSVLSDNVALIIHIWLHQIQL